MIKFTKKHMIQGLTVITVAASGCQVAGATALSHFTQDSDGWIEFADDDGVANNGAVNPGYGGQDFDAEHLFYKLDGNTLSIGLQAGFNLDTGTINYGSKDYYAGDLALSFDGDTGTYEYGFAFGFDTTKDYYNTTVGGTLTHNMGLYDVDENGWNLGVYTGYTESNPFAINAGTWLNAGAQTSAGFGTIDENLSYWRTVSFDITALGLTSFDGFDAHWTMSCGNDAINGSASVPEPATMLLFGTGLVGLAGIRLRTNKKA